jgi:hypothetical protein
MAIHLESKMITVANSVAVSVTEVALLRIRHRNGRTGWARRTGLLTGRVRGWRRAERCGVIEAVAGGEVDADGLVFVAEMYGVQVDQLALVLDVTARRASAVVAGWTSAGLAEAARLGPGPRWVWLTKAGLARCGLAYTAAVPALSRLAHLRAVTAVRLALTATAQFEAGQGYWRGERRLRSKFGRRLGVREHLPDGEVHWPESGRVPWAGECWAIEAELTPKTVAKTVAIMRELLVRTGDYGCATDAIAAPGQPGRHTRAIYLCSPDARPVVSRARQELGDRAGRIEIRQLPAGWALGGPAGPVESERSISQVTRP